MEEPRDVTVLFRDPEHAALFNEIRKLEGQVWKLRFAVLASVSALGSSAFAVVRSFL